MRYINLFTSWWVDSSADYRDNAQIFEIVNDFTRYYGIRINDPDKAFEFLQLVSLVKDTPIQFLRLSITED